MMSCTNYFVKNEMDFPPSTLYEIETHGPLYWRRRLDDRPVIHIHKYSLVPSAEKSSEL